MARHQAETEEVYVEILIRIEGSAESNRITTFKLPIIGRQATGDAGVGAVEFESKVLIKRMKAALDRVL